MKATTHYHQNTFSNTKEPLRITSIKVLLVGNNPMELGQCCRSLINFRAKKFNIETAFSNEECFKKAGKFKPGVIILDDSIGFMNMMEIIEKLNKDPHYAQTPVIVIKNSNYHHATLKEGVAEFIMLDRVLSGELPEIIINTLLNAKAKKANQENTVPRSFEKRISKLLFSLFTPSAH